MKHLVLLAMSIGLLLCACGENCSDLPTEFESHEDAMQKVENTSFEVEETVKTPESSWVEKAIYYSCDGETGFFVLYNKEMKKWIHQGVSTETWKRFKSAESHGTFYNDSIKPGYTLQLK